MLRFALLGFLSLQPMTGYDVERVLNTSLKFVWNAQLSQIYRTLRQLEDDGHVVSTVEPQSGRPDRRVYSITGDGRKAFVAWRDETVTELDVLRLPFMVRFLFSGQRPGHEIVAQLRIMRELHVKQRDRFTGVVAQGIAASAESAAAAGHITLEPLIWDATRRAGEMHEQTWIDWIDETIARIEAASSQQQQQPRQPPKGERG